MAITLGRHGHFDTTRQNAVGEQAMPDAAMPTGIAVGFGAAATVVAGLVAASIPTAYPGWRFGVIAVAVGLFAAISLDQVALAFVALIGFLISNGFLEDRFGQLAWHGSTDLWRALLLVVVAASGLAMGEAIRFVRELRTRRPVVTAGIETVDGDIVGLETAGGAPFVPLVAEESHGA